MSVWSVQSKTESARFDKFEGVNMASISVTQSCIHVYLVDKTTLFLNLPQVIDVLII